MPLVLSIGTSHPRNVAGVGRDLVVGTERGCDVVTALAAVSVQDDRAVHALHVLSAALLRAQLTSLGSRVPAAVRVGALGSAENVAVVAEYLTACPAPAVVDPVRRASTGEPLMDEGAWNALCERLVALPEVVLTPNLDEAAAILGAPALGPDDLEDAARALRARGARAVVLKGGHLPGDPVDVLATSAGIERFAGTRIEARLRGTGCTLAMAIACALAGGASIRDAVAEAREYLRAKMIASVRE